MTNAKPLHVASIPLESGSNYPEPYKSRMGDASWIPLTQPFGLSQFGVNLETLQPGAESALRHWHDLEDEFVYIISGELVLRIDSGEHLMTPGMCMGFKAGHPDAHHLVNRSDAPASYMVIGSRIAADTAFYPDDDLAWLRTGTGNVPVHKDGSAY
jgi:uncharacterized cupin superfamily protein